MAEQPFISKQKSEVEDLDFDALRAAYLGLVQALSGERWTDFNVHDPGVTILEALCYGLSDLAYRTGFDTADYLADSSDGIDFDALALFRADEVLTCDPVTVGDLRKAIHDEIPQIRNVWIERAATGELAPALFTAFVQLQVAEMDEHEENLRISVERRLHEVVGRYRALGEDIESVEFVQVEGFGLRGEVELANGSDALSILAEVHWRAQHYLNPRPRWRSYQEAFEQEKDLDKLLRGPLTKMGLMVDGELASWRDQFFVSELIGVVARVPGVDRVNRLAFVDAVGEEVDAIDLRDQTNGRRVAMIDLRASGDDTCITALRSGQREQFVVAEIEREIARLTIQRNEFQSRPPQFDWISTLLPQGKARQLSEYHSVQHHFPDIYGLNAFGISMSAEPLRHAQALQLKAFLLLHEQAMANFLAQIEEIPDLFAIAPTKDKTYAAMALGNDSVPRIEEIYPLGLDGQRTRLGEIYEEFDDWVERRHRVLNRLLAMHGHDDTRELVDAIAQARGLTAMDALPAKRCLIANIRNFGVSRMRGGSGDAVGDDLHRRPGLELNLSILFGGGNELPGVDEPAPAMVEYSPPIRVVDHILLRRAMANDDGYPKGGIAGVATFLFRVSVVVSEALLKAMSGDASWLIKRAVAHCCPAHIAAEMVLLDERRYEEFIACQARWQLAMRGIDQGKLAAESAALLVFLSA